MNKTASIILTLGLVVTLGIIFFGNSNLNEKIGKNSQVQVNNVEIKDGIQYVTILAKGGYSPKLSTAQAGIPTKLIVKTNGAYDCSSSLVIPSIGYKKTLPQKGDTEIDIGIPKSGEPFQGLCGMGMYNFKINFE